MVLSEHQIKKLELSLIKVGLNIEDFCLRSDDSEVHFFHHLDPSAYSFLVRETIQNARLADVFCEPYTYQPSIYLGCDSFDDILKLIGEWGLLLRINWKAGRIFTRFF